MALKSDLIVSTNVHKVRSVTLNFKGYPASEGDGVQLTRFIGSPYLPMLDPLLLLDMFHADQPREYLPGFPEHPHRGFETVTYLLVGRMHHQDNKGHTGVLESGGVQWMTAGRGIVHSEMPEQENGVLRGFQLWINLPAAQKMTEPRYQEFTVNDIPVDYQPNGSQVRVIAGQTSTGIAGHVQGVSTQPIYYDVTLVPGGHFNEVIPATHNCVILPYQGLVAVVDGTSGREKIIEAGTLAVLGEGDRVQVSAKQITGKFLLIAGKPLNEPVAHGGPFVMNTRSEIIQAFQDYRSGKF